jgi:adenylosuccinate synthase
MPAAASSAIIVIDLGYGDGGKGTVVDFLVREHAAGLVVRFNGGPQAGHNVVTPDGRHHTFAQFGSGTFVPDVRTLLSHFMLIEPYALLNEANHLAKVGVEDALDRLVIDARCPVITPAHQAANRLRELARGARAHGTCGLGMGETMADLRVISQLLLRAGELRDRRVVREKLIAASGLKLVQCERAIAATRGLPQAKGCLATLRDPAWVDVAADNYATLADRATVVSPREADALLTGAGTVVFEGAQGVLLDENFGFHPHTTWSTTTTANADALLDGTAFTGTRRRIGVTRTYATRHGPGPCVTEDPSLRAALPEPHNRDDGWQGPFRVGPLDLVAMRYALSVCPVDELGVTHLDRLAALPPRVCTAYDLAGEALTVLEPPDPDNLNHRARLTDDLRDYRPVYSSLAGGGWESFVAFVQSETGKRVGITSFGPAAHHKKQSGRVG